MTMRKYLAIAGIIVSVTIVTMITRILSMSSNGAGHVLLSDICVRNRVTMASQDVELANGDLYHKWIILVTVNTAYVDFFQNWFWYFQKLKLSVPVMAIAEDDTSFERLSQLYKNMNSSVTFERSETVDETAEDPADYGSAEFNKLVGQRPARILKYLQLGFNVLYTDTDTVWLKDPFPHLVGQFDIWTTLDKPRHCTGFLAIKNNPNTQKFMQKWITYMEKNTWINDQTGFSEMDRSSVCIQGLNTYFFPAGYQYFERKNNTGYSKLYEDVVLVHNNYILGHEKKKERFKKFNLWH